MVVSADAHGALSSVGVYSIVPHLGPPYASADTIITTTANSKLFFTSLNKKFCKS